MHTMAYVNLPICEIIHVGNGTIENDHKTRRKTCWKKMKQPGRLETLIFFACSPLKICVKTHRRKSLAVILFDVQDKKNYRAIEEARGKSADNL